MNAAAELTARELGLTELAEQQHFLAKSQQRTDLEPRELTGRVERIHLKINEALEHSDGTTADFQAQLTARGIKSRAVSHGDRAGYAFAEVDRADVWLTGKQARWTPAVLRAAAIERCQEVTAEKVAQILSTKTRGPRRVTSGRQRRAAAVGGAGPRTDQGVAAVNAAAADAYRQAKSTVAQLDRQLDDAKDQAPSWKTAREVKDEWTAARGKATMVDQARVQQARELIQRRQQLVRLERQVAQLTGQAARRPSSTRVQARARAGQRAARRPPPAALSAERSFADSKEWRPNSPIYGAEDPLRVFELATQRRPRPPNARSGRRPRQRRPAAHAAR